MVTHSLTSDHECTLLYLSTLEYKQTKKKEREKELSTAKRN